MLANVLSEIKTFMYFEFSECSTVADTLVAVGLNTDGPLLWQDHVPDFVASLVSRSTRITLKGTMLCIKKNGDIYHILDP